MLGEKIRLNNAIRNYIKVGRESKGLPVKKISEAIGRTNSYVSALENKRIQKIAVVELIDLLMFIYDLSHQQAEDKIENLLLIKDDIHILDGDEIDDEHQEKQIDHNNIQNYLSRIDQSDDEKFKIYLEMLNKIMKSYYEVRPEDAKRMLQCFIKSCQFDIGYMLAILSLPYFALAPLSFDEKQESFDDITKTFNKHYLIAKSKDSTNETEETANHQ